MQEDQCINAGIVFGSSPTSFETEPACERAGFLAVQLAQAAASLNKIRLKQNGESMFEETRASCGHFTGELMKLNRGLGELSCTEKERGTFVNIERETAEVFLRLAELREEEMSEIDLMFEGLVLTKMSMLCHAMNFDKLQVVGKRKGFDVLRQETPAGLWLHTISVCVSRARTLTNKLQGERKAMKRYKDVQVFVGKFLQVVDDLMMGISSTERLVQGIGEGMAPTKPVVVDQLIHFACNVSGVAAFLSKEWKGLAPCENDQRVALQAWIGEQYETLVSLSPHPVLVPHFGCWYEYLE